MLRLAADESFNGRIVQGLIRRVPDLDIESVQDAGLTAADDPTVLQWAADGGRILLTHDVRTMPSFAYQRLAAGQNMPGLIIVRKQTTIGPIIDALEPLIVAGAPSEYDGRVEFLRF